MTQPVSSSSEESLRELWRKICVILSRELSERSFKTWFEPVSLLESSPEAITLSVPDLYYGKWLERRHAQSRCALARFRQDR
ncbi:MAG: hypothetical protein EOM14_09995 [Clostridia bacterium]|nr:hypothetical protein [Clostridia bacterium]